MRIEGAHAMVGSRVSWSRALIVAATASLVIGAAAAEAATVMVQPGLSSIGGGVRYQAAPGERNDVSVERVYEVEPRVGVFDIGYVVTVSARSYTQMLWRRRDKPAWGRR
jgi:hypothetical protein